MTRPALLALALTAAACGSGGVRVEEHRTLTPAPVLNPRPPQIATPPDGAVILYYADSRCPPSVPTGALPDKAARDCYALRARLALVGILKREKVSPGTKSPCWSYRDPAVYANCLDVAARSLPAQAYGLSGLYVKGTLYGQPWTGCAAGATYEGFIFASLAEPARTLPLVAWESSNHFMKHVYDQASRTDGPLVAEAAAAAKAACGENE